MTVFTLALKGALVLSLAGAAAHLLRRAPAAARHAVWVAAFVALLALPALTVWGPHVEIAVLPESMAQQATPAPDVLTASPALAPLAPEPSAVPLAPIAPLAPVGVPLLLDEPVAPAPALPPLPPAPELAPMPDAVPVAPALAPVAPERSWMPAALAQIRLPRALLVLWAGGALLVLLGWMLPLLAAFHLVRRARPETSGTWLDALEHARLLSDVEGPVRLLRSDRLDVPVAWGWGTPAVVLPADADEWSEDRRQAVLLHELAHLARGDAQTQVLAQVAVALHWFDPLAWWAYGQMLVEREHACDDAVLRGGARPSAYAGHLVDIARGLRRRSTALAGFAPMARHSRLEGRVRSILGDHQRAAVSPFRIAGVAAVAFSLTLPLAACNLTSRTAEAPAPTSSPRTAPTPATAPTPTTRAQRVEAERQLEIAHEALEEAQADLDDLDLDLQMDDLDIDLDLDLDFDGMLADARRQLAEARHLHVDLDVDWNEIEADLAEAQVDYDEAMAEARAALADVDWENEVEEALHDAKHDLQRAMDELRIEMKEAEREVQEETRRETRRAAERAREERQRQLERERRQRDREREQRDRQREQAQARSQNQTALADSDYGFPSTPPGYSYSITSRDGNVVVVAGTGARAWSESLASWRVGLDAILSQVSGARTSNQVASVQRSLSGMEIGLDGIERSGNGWARTSADRRLVRDRVAEARTALATASRQLDGRSSGSCEEG